MIRTVACCLVSVLLVTTAAGAQPSFHEAPVASRKTPNPESGPAAIQAGSLIYATHCASCHGVIGEGNGNIPALARGPSQQASDGELFWFITHGSVANGMPAWPQLSATARWQVVAFLHALPSIVVSPASVVTPASVKPDPPPPQPPFTDFRFEAPGVVHRITEADLPPPYATGSAGNPPNLVLRPADAWPKAPPGFKVELYAGGLSGPRIIRTAPNGDLFVAESNAGRIRVLRGVTADGKAASNEVFAAGLDHPFGLAFYPRGANPEWLYVGDTDQLLRLPYRNGDLIASGAPQHLADLPAGRGHWTRNVVFAKDDKTLFVAVGSGSNVADPDDTPSEKERADILQFNPDGSGRKIFASGIRNCVGLAVNPANGDLWCSVNERDGLGDNLVPDYITHVEAGGFYGWPWWYIGGHQDPRLAGKHPELKTKTLVPDVLLQPHNASLGITFYEGSQFPADYRGNIFAAEHGSWNKSVRVGYEVIRLKLDQNGHADGSYEDFLTGFVVDAANVWGRPVGVTVASDGALLVTDDGSGSIWRVTYVGP